MCDCNGGVKKGKEKKNEEPCETLPCQQEPTVVIKDETGLKDPCRLIPKGKTHKFKAIGTPDKGKYKWTPSGKISIVGSSTDQIVEVKGDNISGSLDDSKLKVKYTKGKTVSTEIKLTVFEITKIEAKLRATTCKRDGSRAVVMPAKQSTKDSKTFDASALTVVRECGELKLTASITPAGVPLSWDVERASDDAASLTGLPTHTKDGSDTKRKLSTDATGSFHVIAFVDCNKNSKRDPNEGAIILNVNIVNIEIIAGGANNKILTRNTLFSNTRSDANDLVIDSGTFKGYSVNTAYTDAEFLLHPLGMKVTMKLTGGGSNQLRGTDKIGLGYIQSTTADSVKGTYSDNRTVKEVIVQNVGIADPIKSGTPTMLAFPVRDTRGAANSGTGVFINSSTDVEKSNLAKGGQKRVARFIDPPAIVIPMKHPVTNSNLKSISGSNDFEVFLSAYSSDFDENYTAIATETWSITYGTYTAAHGWKKTGAAVTAPASMSAYSPLKKGEDTNMERCPPNFVDNLRMDAR